MWLVNAPIMTAVSYRELDPIAQYECNQANLTQSTLLIVKIAQRLLPSLTCMREILEVNVQNIF